MSHIDEGLQVSKTKWKLPFYRVCSYFLSTLDSRFHKRVGPVGIKIRIQVFEEVMHTC